MIKRAKRSDVGWIDAGVQTDPVLLAHRSFQSRKVLLVAYGLLQQLFNTQKVLFAIGSCTSETGVSQTPFQGDHDKQVFFGYISTCVPPVHEAR